MTPVPRVAVVAGSGLDLTGILDQVRWEEPFDAFEGLSSTSVEGHTGSFTQGTCGKIEVVVQQGRRHFYEGLTFGEVAAPVHVLAALGVQGVLFTNAAGGLRPEFEPGNLLAVERLRTWPYHGWLERPAELVPDWVAPECDATGAYMWVHGPSYETQAEIGCIQAMDVSAVGMSTAPELAAALRLGMRTGALSCITNNCCRARKLTHHEVLTTAERASVKLCETLRRGLPDFAGAF